MTVGSRFLRENANADGCENSLPRKAGIAYFRLVLRTATRRSFSDLTSGFRAYSRGATRFLADRKSRRYPETHWLLLLSRAGYRVSEVAVVMRPRRYDHSSIGLREAITMTAGATACLLRHPGREVPKPLSPRHMTPVTEAAYGSR